MTVAELMKEMLALSPERIRDTVDTLKYGDEFAEVTSVVTCHVATPDIIREAARLGAQLIITHEPTFYENRDYQDINWDDPIISAKRKVLSESGLTVWRYHDHPHRCKPDLIYTGTLKALGLDAEGDFDIGGIATLKTPMTAREIARLMCQKLGADFVRVSGTLDEPMSRFASFYGAPGVGRMMELLMRPDVDMVFTGETCEWSVAEYARDAAQLGIKKAVFLIGHEVSEHAGMDYVAQILRTLHPELTVTYLRSGAVYEHIPG